MKSKMSKIPKDLRPQVGLTCGRGSPIQSTALDWVRLSKETLPNATPLTPEERISINEFFWFHFK